MPPPPPPGAMKVSQQKSAISAEMSLSAEKKAKYTTGMLVWGKMTGYPFWPCMITEDPLLRVYTRVTGNCTAHYFGLQISLNGLYGLLKCVFLSLTSICGIELLTYPKT